MYSFLYSFLHSPHVAVQQQAARECICALLLTAGSAYLVHGQQDEVLTPRLAVQQLQVDGDGTW